MSYQAVLDELNKNLELYLQNKCDPPLNHLSKALTKLTIAIEQDMKEQQKTLRALRKSLEAMEQKERTRR